MTGLDLKLERVRLGLRQYRVAAAIDVPQSRLSQWENGKQPVTPEQAAAVRDAMRTMVATSSHANHRRTVGAAS